MLLTFSSHDASESLADVRSSISSGPMGMPGYLSERFEAMSQGELARAVSQLTDMTGTAPARVSIVDVLVTPQMVIDGDRCAICVEEVQADEMLSRLPCEHWFHQGCVMKWLRGGHDTCPHCRALVGSPA